MTVTTGATVTKFEPTVLESPILIEPKQSIDLKYEINGLDSVVQLGRINNGQIEIEYPVESAEMLTRLQTIESQFAFENAKDGLDNQEVDHLINELTPVCLEAEGAKIPDDPTFAARVRALILKQIRGLRSDEKLNHYLQDNPDTAQMLGFGEGSDELVSSSAYTRVRKKLDIDSKSVQNGIKRLRHMLFRNGIILDVLSNEGYTVNQIVPYDSKLSSNLRNCAIINYSELLLQHLTDGVTFHRGTSTTFTVREIIATVAKLALHENLEKAHRLTQLQYQDDIISLGQLNNIIHRNIGEENFTRSKQKIERLGTRMTRNLLGFADNNLGCFRKPLDIAIDPTWIHLGRKVEPEMVQGAMGNRRGGGIRFATAVSYTTMARFSLGVYLITDKSKYPNTWRRILSLADEFADIGWVLADREFNGVETIEVFRYMAGDTWLIRLKDDDNLIDIERLETDGELKLKQEGKVITRFGGIEVNAYWKTLEDSGFSLPFGQEDDRIILISGIPIDETDPVDVMPRYTDRWSAETYIRQLKHSFLPSLNRISALEYLFYLNISSAFYNIYKIMNQSLSPIYGLPLRPRYYEVLSGIADATFRRQPQPSHLLEQ